MKFARSSIPECNSLTVRRFGYLQRLEFEKHFPEGDSPICGLTLYLCDDVPTAAQRLELRFLRVVDLKMGDLNSLLWLQLTLYDISDRQLERQNVRAVDEE